LPAAGAADTPKNVGSRVYLWTKTVGSGNERVSLDIGSSSIFSYPYVFILSLDKLSIHTI
jgi:hypothetical protein